MPTFGFFHFWSIWRGGIISYGNVVAHTELMQNTAVLHINTVPSKSQGLALIVTRGTIVKNRFSPLTRELT